MADPTLAGYNPSSSLIPQVAGDIKPMMGGGNEDRDIKLFGKVYTIPNIASMNETDLNLNKNIQEIMKLLNFNMLSFEEKKKILQSLYDSNCTNETDLALSCGCDPVRKVIADLATLLLKKTSEKIELPTPTKRIDTAKKQVEISIRIPLEMIRVVMSSNYDISGAPTPITPATANTVDTTIVDTEEMTPATDIPTITVENSNSESITAAPAVTIPTKENEANASIASKGEAVPIAEGVTLTPGGKPDNAIGISMGGNNTRKLRLSNK